MSKSDNNICRILRDRQTSLHTETFRAQLFSRRLRIAKNLYKNDILCSYGCVNAIEFSKEGKYLITGGDDRRVLFFNVDQVMVDPKKARVTVMQKTHESNVFALAFDNSNAKIFSGGNDNSCIVHDIESGEAADVFLHTKPVYGIAVNPTNDKVFSTAGEDGQVLLFDLRTSSETMNLAKYRTPFHSVCYHPLNGNVIATANAKEGAALWDVRLPRIPTLRFGGDHSAESCMSVRFNATGSQVLALRRRLPPVLYTTHSTEPVCQFYHLYYYNSCTMKSCCFAGEFDEYVLSGSDDFNLYVWKVPDVSKSNQWVEDSHLVLYGHRSIVNQVRYNAQKCIIASSGVEKVVKLWSPFELHDWRGKLLTETHSTETARKLFTYDEYLSMVHTGGQSMNHDYSNQNTREDPRMMAFFDHLVQQEIEGWGDTLSQTSSSENSEPSSRRDSSSASAGPTRLRGAKTGAKAKDIQQRTRYRNRIAYLIATKRKKLKRLALKSTPKYKRPYSRKFRVVAGKRGAAPVRPPRTTKRRKNVKRAARDMTSDSEAPQPSKKRRLTSSYTPLTYKSFRKKVKTPPSSTSNTSTRAADKSDTSSSDDEERKASLAKLEAERRKLFLDVPSTSTGITSNGKGVLFRINRKTYEDSEDDLSDVPAPERVPSPVGLRGSFDEEDHATHEYFCSSPSNNSVFSSSFHDEHDDNTLTSCEGDDSETKTATTTPQKSAENDGGVDSGTASATSSMIKCQEIKGIDSKLLLDKLNRVKNNCRKAFDDSDSD